MWVVGVLLVLARTISAQQIGTDICACQPSIVTFTINFAFKCVESNVEGPGILETTCLTELTGDDETRNTTDVAPVSVTEVQVLELDENKAVIAQTQFDTGPYSDGASFTYTSIVVDDPDSVTTSNFPKGFQVIVKGISATEEAVQNTWAIIYSNDCGIFPLLEVGEQIGWVNFTDLGVPPQEFCPIATPPVSPPTSAPIASSPPETASPTLSPSFPLNVTDAPSAAEPETLPPGKPTCPPVGKYSKTSSDRGSKASKDKGSDDRSSKEAKGSDATKSVTGSKGKKGSVVTKSGKTESEPRGAKGSKGATGQRYLNIGDRDECPEPEESSNASAPKSKAASGTSKQTESKGSVPKGTTSSVKASKDPKSVEDTSKKQAKSDDKQTGTESTSQKKSQRLRHH